MFFFFNIQVAPSEIEDVISSHPAVKLVCVVPVEDDAAGEVPLACVILKDRETATEQEIVILVKGESDCPPDCVTRHEAKCTSFDSFILWSWFVLTPVLNIPNNQIHNLREFGRLQETPWRRHLHGRLPDNRFRENSAQTGEGHSKADLELKLSPLKEQNSACVKRQTFLCVISAQRILPDALHCACVKPNAFRMTRENILCWKTHK